MIYLVNFEEGVRGSAPSRSSLGFACLHGESCFCTIPTTEGTQSALLLLEVKGVGGSYYLLLPKFWSTLQTLSLTVVMYCPLSYQQLKTVPNFIQCLSMDSLLFYSLAKCGWKQILNQFIATVDSQWSCDGAGLSSAYHQGVLSFIPRSSSSPSP